MIRLLWTGTASRAVRTGSAFPLAYLFQLPAEATAAWEQDEDPAAIGKYRARWHRQRSLHYRQALHFVLCGSVDSPRLIQRSLP